MSWRTQPARRPLHLLLGLVDLSWVNEARILAMRHFFGFPLGLYVSGTKDGRLSTEGRASDPASSRRPVVTTVYHVVNLRIRHALKNGICLWAPTGTRSSTVQLQRLDDSITAARMQAGVLVLREAYHVCVASARSAELSFSVY
jgi:hypothetical protein